MSNEPSIHSDLCMEPVCMAKTKDLIREIKKRYACGTFILYEPVPQNQEQYEIWKEENQEHGFTVWPERFHRQDNVWGHKHLLLGLLSRLAATIHNQLDEEERDIPEEEQF